MPFNKITTSISESKFHPVIIKEEPYFVKGITSKYEKFDAHRLRYKIFCQELGWVDGWNNYLEMDVHDENAIFIGVFDDLHNLKAFLRIIMPENIFMLEKEFQCLVDQCDEIRKEKDTAEISRLCVESDARKEYVSMILYKGVYRWCLNSGIRYLYFVVEEKFYRSLCIKGFPCKLVGEQKIMPDGVIAVAVMLDLQDFEKVGKKKRPKTYEWFNRN